MKRLIVVLIFFFTFSSPVLAMEKLSADDLKKITAQIASTAGHASDGSTPASEVYGLASNLAEGSGDIGNITSVAGPVGVAQTATNPVRIVSLITNDINGFKSGVSFGFF